MQGHTTETPLPRGCFGKMGPLLSLKGLPESAQDNVSHWYTHLSKSCL